MAELITTHVEPVIKGVVRYKLHFNSQQALEQAQADDIRQEVLVQVLAELQKLREQPQTHPISDVRGLATVIVHRACARWMRRRFPERHALKNRLYYLLTRQNGFALWQNENQKLMAGFAAWQCRAVITQLVGLCRRIRRPMVTKKDSTSASENRKGQASVGNLPLNKETVKDLTAQDLKKVKGGLVVNTIIGVILPMPFLRSRRHKVRASRHNGRKIKWLPRKRQVRKKARSRSAS
jgi:hypothetical protein